ncbi:MAG: hypothetical protein ABFS56_24880, partial [Pseudomonadota bacterium]
FSLFVKIYCIFFLQSFIKVVECRLIYIDLMPFVSTLNKINAGAGAEPVNAGIFFAQKNIKYSV